MSSRILFVDDEPMVLQALQRALRKMKGEWQMDFANDGASALSEMAKAPFDVIIADMRMPGMNGAELLNEVMKLYPSTVRFILSGHAEEELIMRCVGITHQYLSKPCDPEELRGAIQRALSVGSSLSNTRLKELISKIDNLPSIPSLYTELVEALQESEVTVDELAAIVSKDMAMTAKILQLVNSAFFGLSRKVTDISTGINYLGINTLKTLVLTIHAFDQFEGVKGNAEFLNHLWSHSLQVAAASKRIAQIEGLPSVAIESAFVAGMLHDVGQLVLRSNIHNQYDDIVRLAHDNRLSLDEAEQSVLGATHAEVGGYLLGLWGLPVPIVEAITLHHKPGSSLGRSVSPLTAVHIAEALCQPASGPEAAPPVVQPDPNYLAMIGLENRMDAWR